MIGKAMTFGLVAAMGAGALFAGVPAAQSATVTSSEVASVEVPIASTPSAPHPAPLFVEAAAPVDAATARYVSVARRELVRLGSAIPNHDRVAIVDFSRPSDQPRLFLVDVESGAVSAFRVTHGKGSDPLGTGRLQSFSSGNGSEATSRGAYRTAELYTGQHGRSMRLDGLDPDNRSARARAIVVHAAAYAEPSVIAAQGRLGRSQGCFALSSADLNPVLDFLGQGRLLFADRI